MSLIKNQTPDSLTTMASPLLLVHMFNSSKHEKMWLWLGGNVHCRQHHSTHSPWVLPTLTGVKGCLLPAPASCCLKREQESMRPLDSWQVLVSLWSSTNFRWKLMDKYCSFLMTGGKTERHVLCHLPEFSSRTEPQLPSVAICSLKRPILASFPSLSLLATSLLVLSRIFSLITYLHMNLFSGSSFRGTQTERQILETSLLSSSWT